MNEKYAAALLFVSKPVIIVAFHQAMVIMPLYRKEGDYLKLTDLTVWQIVYHPYVTYVTCHLSAKKKV